MTHSLVTHNGKIVCLRYDGNGFLYKALIEPIHETVVMCDECEAMWPGDSAQSINGSNFRDFTTYLQGLGYMYDEVTFTSIDYDWY